MQFFSLCDEDSDGRICYEDWWSSQILAQWEGANHGLQAS